MCVCVCVYVYVFDADIGEVCWRFAKFCRSVAASPVVKRFDA